MRGGTGGDDAAAVVFVDRFSIRMGEWHGKSILESRSSTWANTAWTNGAVERMMLDNVKTFRAVASAAKIPLKDWVRMGQAALNAGYRERRKASALNLMFGRKPFSTSSALVAPGKDE